MFRFIISIKLFLEKIKLNERKNFEFIITTRLSHLSDKVNNIEVDFFTKKEALEYLNNKKASKETTDLMLTNICMHPKIFTEGFAKNINSGHSLEQLNFIINEIKLLNDQLPVILRNSGPDKIKTVKEIEQRIVSLLKFSSYKDIRNFEFEIKDSIINEQTKESEKQTRIMKLGSLFSELTYKIGVYYENAEGNEEIRHYFYKLLYTSFENLYDVNNNDQNLEYEVIKWFEKINKIISSSKDFKLFNANIPRFVPEESAELQRELEIKAYKNLKEMYIFIEGVTILLNDKELNNYNKDKSKYEEAIYKISELKNNLMNLYTIECEYNKDEKVKFLMESEDDKYIRIKFKEYPKYPPIIESFKSNYLDLFNITTFEEYTAIHKGEKSNEEGYSNPFRSLLDWIQSWRTPAITNNSVVPYQTIKKEISKNQLEKAYYNITSSRFIEINSTSHEVLRVQDNRRLTQQINTLSNEIYDLKIEMKDKFDAQARQLDKQAKEHNDKLDKQAKEHNDKFDDQGKQLAQLLAHFGIKNEINNEKDEVHAVKNNNFSSFTDRIDDSKNSILVHDR